jgi:hypothetical protein
MGCLLEKYRFAETLLGVFYIAALAVNGIIKTVFYSVV